MATPDKGTQEAGTVQFPVVGIGASAGGLDALKKFLGGLTADSGMAYVFVQHLSPSHVSILPEILAAVSPIPVEQITDHIVLEKDKLYVIPENKMVTTVDGQLRLSELDINKKQNDVIDIFFTSLGIAYQSYAVGIVLSGNLQDGTVGLQVIKSHGGLTFAQDGGTATHNSMPNSAVKAGVIDFVMPPEKIAAHLISINKPFNSVLAGHEDDDPLKHDDDVFKQILTVLRVRRGVDFQYYKSSTLKRRIIRRMALIKIERPAEYLYYLRENKAEQDALYNDMLISVTAFFRDHSSFSILCEEVFPELIKQKQDTDQPVRLWIAGCATGEEAYSMAICLQEYLGDKTSVTKVQLFATDISETAIAKARSGMYTLSEMEGLSASRIQQFFTKIDGKYQINKAIRDMCVFAHHNLLKDPPFSKIDLLSCRNVLIYLEPVLQKKALATFHYSLNENGYLMLGKSETAGSSDDIFSPFNSAGKIYRKKGPAGRYMNVASTAREQNFRDINLGVRKDETEKDIFKVAEDVMLANLILPCVLTNEKYDIIQFKGLTDQWLALPTGKPSFNLLRIARNGLAFEIKNLLLQAAKNKAPVKKFNVSYKMDDLVHFVNLQAIPISHLSEEFYLVSFMPASTMGIQPGMFETERMPHDGAYDESGMRIEHLERELIQSRADMRMVIEEQELTNENLRRYNEDLLSSSEEMQSLNEELETSKEELQSTNEEIAIVNKELGDRNDRLNKAQEYTEAIINTIRDPLIVLDRNLRIRRASRSFYARFKLAENPTEGRHFYEIDNGVWNITELRDLLERILPEHRTMEDFRLNLYFPKLGKLTLLLNARQITIAGDEELILLALEDTSANTATL